MKTGANIVHAKNTETGYVPVSKLHSSEAAGKNLQYEVIQQLVPGTWYSIGFHAMAA